MNSKSINTINQNIYISQFIFIIEGYISYLLKDYIDKDKK
jgi:hypothetical protein